MELLLFSWALGKQCCVGRAGAGPETLLQARLTCSTSTLQSRTGWEAAGSLGLGGFWVMAGAGVLQIWGDRCRRVYGFLGTHSPKGLGTSEIFLLQNTVKSPIHGGVSALWSHQQE